MPLLIRLGVDSAAADVAAAVLVTAAVGVAVGRSTPARSAVVIAVGAVGHVVMRALLIGLVNASIHVQRGLNPDGAGTWRKILDHGLAVARSHLGTGLPGYPRLAGVIVCGALAGVGWTDGAAVPCGRVVMGRESTARARS